MAHIQRSDGQCPGKCGPDIDQQCGAEAEKQRGQRNRGTGLGGGAQPEKEDNIGRQKPKEHIPGLKGQRRKRKPGEELCHKDHPPGGPCYKMTHYGSCVWTDKSRHPSAETTQKSNRGHRQRKQVADGTRQRNAVEMKGGQRCGKEHGSQGDRQGPGAGKESFPRQFPQRAVPIGNAVGPPRVERLGNEVNTGNGGKGKL